LEARGRHRPVEGHAPHDDLDAGGGKKVRALKGKKFAARLKAIRLTAGKHRLLVRVKTQAGKVRTFKVRLKLA
jgi:hypothetical protein